MGCSSVLGLQSPAPFLGGSRNIEAKLTKILLVNVSSKFPRNILSRLPNYPFSIKNSLNC